MSPKDKANKKDHPAYLVITLIEELIDEGLIFDGTSEKDRVINQFDFSRIREILQRYGQQLTPDQTETLVRYLKLCVKDPDSQ